MTESMIPKTPTPADNLPDTLSNFTPVPRKRVQHSGWVPERQRMFIQALAETGNATRAAKMVNMSVVAAYQLRRAPGASGTDRVRIRLEQLEDRTAPALFTVGANVAHSARPCRRIPPMK